MKWFPYESWEVESPLSHETLTKAIAARIENPDKQRVWRHLLGKKRENKALEGTVKGQNFTLNRVIYHHDSLLPRLYGRLHPHEQGTTISITMMPQPSVFLFLFFWFGMLLLMGALVFFLSQEGNRWLKLLPLLGMGLFGIILPNVKFYSGAGKIKEQFSELLSDIHAEARRGEKVTDKGRREGRSGPSLQL